MRKYVVIDLETTGNSSGNNDKIMEVGMVVIEENVITREYGTLLNPEKSIPVFISTLTGITDEDVKTAPFFRDVAKDIVELMKDSYIVAHNIPFDLGFLNEELAACGMEPLVNPVIDTVELARTLYPQAPSYKLASIAKYVHIEHVDPHRALSDAYVTTQLFLKLTKKLESLPYETLTHLLQLEKMFKSDLYELLTERHGALAFSTNVQEDIVTHQGLAFKKVADPKGTKPDLETSYGDYLDRIYESNGTIETKMPNYEYRGGQREISEEIYHAFQSHTHALIEAETGTGKTLAYLIPAIYDAVKTNKHVVISTFTTQLQSQLLDEEIPLIRNIVQIPFRATLLKGKHHYISLEKFANTLATNQGDNYDVVLTKAMLLVWITETDTGDIDEIQLPSSGYHFYKRVSTDSEGVLDPFSPWIAYSYYQKARKRAQKADVVITNHALLCTDMFNGYSFLPNYEKVIIDEAHHLESTASKHYGFKIDYLNIHYTLSQLSTTDKINWFRKLLKRNGMEKDKQFMDNWNHIYSQTVYEVDDLFRTLFQYVIDQQKGKKTLSDIGRIQYRFDESNEEPNKWDVIKEMVTRLTFYLRDLIHILSQMEQFLSIQEQLNKHDQGEIQDTIYKLQSIIDHMEQLFLTKDTNTKVKWFEIEKYGAKNAISIYSEPIEVSTLLSEDFFGPKQSVVMTSATLTMKDSFAYIQNSLGIPTDRLITKKVNSPFSYQNQVQLLVPDDFPDIKHGNLDDFIYSTCEAILSLAEITKGRMLVLFTSYDMLKKSYYLLNEIMDTDKYRIIAQGVSSGSRSRLKKNFIRFNPAILLGTSSFWEGVDIPGEDLSCLMIVRLPFQSPEYPMYEAKSRYLKNSGKNAFFELSLPNAVIKFKQGFGRLIRSTNDRGIVFVCDARIIQARYGKFFTESIPNVPITYASTHQLMNRAEEWF